MGKTSLHRRLSGGSITLDSGSSTKKASAPDKKASSSISSEATPVKLPANYASMRPLDKLVYLKRY